MGGVSSNFAIYILLLQNTTIMDQNVRVSILESSVLTNPEEMIMNITVLNYVTRVFICSRIKKGRRLKGRKNVTLKL